MGYLRIDIKTLFSAQEFEGLLFSWLVYAIQAMPGGVFRQMRQTDVPEKRVTSGNGRSGPVRISPVSSRKK